MMQLTRWACWLSMMLVVSCVVGCAGHRETPVYKDVQVIAHRGASAYAPENTVASFRKAVEMKADWFELDVTFSKDHELVIMHDGDVERTTDGTGRVADLTLEELKKFDAGSSFDAAFVNERIPTLREALDTATAETGVYIEVKMLSRDEQLLQQLMQASAGQTTMTPELRAEFMRLIEASGTPNLELTRRVLAELRGRADKPRVVIQSFSPVIVFVALTEGPEFRVELLGAEDDDDAAHWPRLVQFSWLIGVPGFNADHESLSEERIRAFHDHGQTVAVWTVDHASIVERVAGWGADAIITNKPDMALDALGRTGV